MTGVSPAEWMSDTHGLMRDLKLRLAPRQGPHKSCIIVSQAYSVHLQHCLTKFLHRLRFLPMGGGGCHLPMRGCCSLLPSQASLLLLPCQGHLVEICR